MSQPLAGAAKSHANDSLSPEGGDLAGSALSFAAQICPLRASDLPELMAIESRIYPFPWTVGNFRDSLASGYSGWALRGREHQTSACDSILHAYAIVMYVLDEAHLMNLSVSGAVQRQGVGRHFLSWLCEKSAQSGAAGMFLEVRPSNIAATALYDQAGFQRIGLRRNYYPNGPEGREDAVVMRKSLLLSSAI